jgi:hypothetical protein
MGHAEPQVLSVSLAMTPEIASELQTQQGALDLARAYTLTGSIEEKTFLASEANKYLRTVKASLTRVKELKAGFVAPAKQIIANAEALFDPAIDALAKAETFLKGELVKFDAEVKRLADEARRRREDEERAARQKAEQEAAAARARAEQEAREKERQAREAEERRLAAEREGNSKAAAKAAAEKAKAEEGARAAIETGEAKAMEVQLAASAAPTTTEAPEAVKLAGFSTRENYVSELAPGVLDEETALALLVAGIAGVDAAKLQRRDLLALIKIDWPAANKLAKAQKTHMNAPGLVAKNRPVASSRAA